MIVQGTEIGRMSLKKIVTAGVAKGVFPFFEMSVILMG